MLNGENPTNEEISKQACDKLIELAAETMVKEAGASVPMMLDRMLTYAAAQACSIDGSPNTAAMFREMADRIDAGLFHGVTGEVKIGRSRH